MVVVVVVHVFKRMGQPRFVAIRNGRAGDDDATKVHMCTESWRESKTSRREVFYTLHTYTSTHTAVWEGIRVREGY